VRSEYPNIPPGGRPPSSADEAPQGAPRPTGDTSAREPSDGRPSDETLYLEHIAGDSEAFKALFARYAGRLAAVMKHRGLSDVDAQDLVQQTFLHLHQARHDFKVGLPLRPWLWTIAFNLLRSNRRGHGRLLQHVERSSRPSQVHGATVAEDREGVRQAILRLSAKEQEVVLLHWYEGLTFSEIAAVLHATEAAVKVRAHRAYQRLRQLLDDSLGEAGEKGES
jgi:RNA polymerase sigma factor (sigma-70 family)